MPSAITNQKQDRDFRAFVEELFRRLEKQGEPARLLDLEVPRPYQIRVKVVYSPSSPAFQLSQIAKRDARLRPLGDGNSTYIFKPTAQRDIAIPFVVLSFIDVGLGQRVAAIVSVCKRDSWIYLRRLLKAHYPGLVSIRLSQVELIDAARRLRHDTGHDIKVRAFSAKERIASTSIHHRRSVREWTYEQLDDVLELIQERRQVVTSMEFEFYPKIGELKHVLPRATCKILKHGEIEVSGSFRLVLESAVTHVARVGERKLGFYSDRGMRQAHYEPRPLAIDYSGPLFEDLRNVRLLVSILAKYPHSMRAVHHGNPYARVAVTDLLDSSAFEIWAVPPSRLTLIPGLKASEAAFERLVHYIFDAFREGRIANYE